ncbi:MAG: hypothetical protein LBQ84_02205 [Flavobacteriaceae bacterium]|jgi:uncharacterized tellurite resistance protein B-like protein|nr:hypothetical protein [Flavobacteriaceae bacterium]
MLDAKELKLYNNSFWNDSLIRNYYVHHFDDLNSKELDKEFSHDLKMFAKTLSKLSDSDRKAFIKVMMSRVIESYIDHKIEKELTNSIHKVLKF